MAAQNSVLSAHWAKARAMPLSRSGYRLGSGWWCSSTSQMSAVSQKMSAPTCRKGVRR